MPNPNLPIAGNFNTYVGARYVPKFADPIEWNQNTLYEPLTIVTYQGNSYTSKTFVPIGTDINNEIYWARTGNYNAQVEQISQQYLTLQSNVNSLNQTMVYANNPAVLSYELMLSKAYKHYYLYDDNSVNATYGSFQGFTQTNNTFLAILIPIEYLFNFKNITDLAVIVEYDSQFNELRRSNPIKLYHANTMAFYNGTIYVNANSSGSEAVPKIVVVNYNTFTVQSEIDIDRSSNFIWFENDYMYTGTRSHIEKRQINGTLISSTSLTGNPPWHSIKPYPLGGYIATSNEPNNIYLLDNNFNTVKIYEIYGQKYQLGEIKDIAFHNNDVFIPYNDRSYLRFDNAELSETYISILKFNLNKNVIQSREVCKSYGNFGTAYVDTSKTNTKIQIGTSDQPYTTILQALRKGCDFINLINSDGCAIFGSGLQFRINSSLMTNIIYFVQLYGCDVSGSFFTCENTVVPTLIYGSNLKIPNCTYNNLFNTNYSTIITDTAQIPIKEGALSQLLYPLNYVSTPNQKWSVSINGNSGNINLTSFPSIGISLIQISITINNITYVAHLNACNGNNWSQYFITLTQVSNVKYVLEGYIEFSISNGTLSAELQRAYVNNESITNFTINYIHICHTY